MTSTDMNTPTAIKDDTIHVAFELSNQKWLMAARVPGQGQASQYVMAPGDRTAITARLSELRQSAARTCGIECRIVSCYEAGYSGFWLHRWLEASGVENLVFDPTSVMVDRRARRAKTDGLDVVKLLRTLIAHCRGEPDVVRVVRVPSVEQEDARRPGRWRERLITERTAHLNRIKGLLLTLGLTAGEPRRREWPAWLAAQRDWAGQPVPGRLTAELIAEHARLMVVEDQVAKLEAARATLVGPEVARRAARLARLKGIGPVVAGTLASEVFWKDFTNRRQVAGYLGLTPSPWQSGSVARDQGISKAGNRRARTVMIEAAWLWLRHQPDNDLSRWFKDRVGDGRGRIRRIAIVALARKLVVALWRFLTQGLMPAHAALKA